MLTCSTTSCCCCCRYSFCFSSDLSPLQPLPINVSLFLYMHFVVYVSICVFVRTHKNLPQFIFTISYNGGRTRWWLSPMTTCARISISLWASLTFSSHSRSIHWRLCAVCYELICLDTCWFVSMCLHCTSISAHIVRLCVCVCLCFDVICICGLHTMRCSICLWYLLFVMKRVLPKWL